EAVGPDSRRPHRARRAGQPGEAGCYVRARGPRRARRADRRGDQALGRGREGRGDQNRMKIARISATPLSVPVVLDAAGMQKSISLSVCLAEVETDDGRVGHGLTAITEEEVAAAAI